MRINRVKIKNFKGFIEETFDFEEQFTLLIGNNASGKTSILEALSIALASAFIEMEAVSSIEIKEKEIRVETISGQPRPQKPVSIEAQGMIDEDELTWKREILNSKTTNKDARDIAKIFKDKVEKSRQGKAVNFPLIAYYSTARLWLENRKIKYSRQNEGFKMAYQNCLSAKSSSKDFLSWFKTQEDNVRKFDRDLEKAHLKALKDVVIAMIPDNKWQNMVFDYKQDELIGLFSNEEGIQQELKYSQLSDGYRNVISLAADIAYRCIQLNPHLGENAVKESKGMVLIDELDLHLHPKWQRRIVADFKRVFPNIQFVATSHSPFIVQSLKKTELINLDKNEGVENDLFKYSIEDVSEFEMGVEMPQRSEKFVEMQNQAKVFFDLVKNNSETDKIQQAKQKLDELRALFNDNPAYIALLQSEIPI